MTQPATWRRSARTFKSGNDGTGTRWKPGSTAWNLGPGPLAGFISGIVPSNGSDATNDLDFTAGTATDLSDGTIIPCAAMTKRLDADFAEGTDHGMRYSGAAIADTTYHVNAIMKANGQQDYFAIANGGPAIETIMPEGFVKYRRIFSFTRVGGSIVAFWATEDNGGGLAVDLDSPPPDVGENPASTNQIVKALSVPKGIRVPARIFAEVRNGVGAAVICRMRVTSTEQTDQATDAVHRDLVAPIPGATLESRAQAEIIRKTDTSGQIAYRVDATANVFVVMFTLGWTDARRS